jgi:G6PDH family F420-dependent oxidoreductase
MVELGYQLSSEEHGPAALVDQAARAEQAGFSFVCVSDHFHPWVHEQGQSPLAWTVLGGIARATNSVKVGTAVTCPTLRYHPAIVAQGAATAAAMMPGRFFLGVGSGENLNEHVVGRGWPAPDARLDMLEEAVEIIRELWTGEMVTHRGPYFTVEHARLFTLPDEPPPIVVAASKSLAAELAGRIGDALWNTAPDSGQVERFRSAGGGNKPVYGGPKLLYGPDQARARRDALRIWPNAGVPGDLSQELRDPEHFDQMRDVITEEKIASLVPCGPDVGDHVDAVRMFAEAGFTHVHLTQVGPEQEAFFRFFEQELRPALEQAGIAGATAPAAA